MKDINNIMNNFFRNNGGNLNILGKLVVIVLIFISIIVINKIISGIIDKTLDRKKGSNLLMNDKRANTLGSVLKKIVYYTLLFIGIMIVLDMFNIPTASILATAGIGGLAIGFGAQSLVKDIITGFFILLEDQYSVGDYIETGEYGGIVEELGLRVTKIRDFSGGLHIIPNSNIQIVTNNTRGAMRASVEVSIAYEEDINRAIEVLQGVCDEIRDSNDSILEGPDIVGVENLGDYDVVLRIVTRTKAMSQWDIERQIRKKSKEALQRENIEIPYPKNILIRDKEDIGGRE